MASSTLLPGYDTNGAMPCDTFIVRPMRLLDIPILAQIQTKVFWKSPIHNFIMPHAPAHPSHCTRNFQRSLATKYTVPNGLSLVACFSEMPDIVVAYGQSVRLGTDAGAKAYVAGRGCKTRVWLWVLSWVFWAFFTIWEFLEPDLATDPKNLALFRTYNVDDSKTYWGSQHPERQNRWYTQSLIVDPPCQGKGIGKLLMREVLKKAQEDGVVLGLGASPSGYYLYKSLGFQWLGDFGTRIGGPGNTGAGGGIMIWYPEGWQGVRAEEKKKLV